MPESFRSMAADSPTGMLLRDTLQVAVPMWVERWRERYRSWPQERIYARSRELGQVVAEKGDVIQFRGGKKGETAAAFNALAEGLALMSMHPGGVLFLGIRWAADPAVDSSAPSPQEPGTDRHDEHT